MSENKETKIQEQEPNISSAVIYHIEKVSKRWIIFASIAFAALAYALIHQMNLKQESDREWKELFNSYDYISQDGNGENYYNSNVSGEVNNGTTDKE